MKRFLMAVAMILMIASLLAGHFAIADAQDLASLSGKVVETMSAGRYTYVLIEKDGNKTWVAIPETKIEIGQNIVLKQGIEMVNFESRSLNRKFSKIYFSGGLKQEE
jgi:hypothetical protein